MGKNNDSATLTLPDGQSIELPTVVGSLNERAVNISSLRSTTGWITLDGGYGNTGSCTSDITFVNGEEGILRYRGYPIEQLAAKSCFLEVSYLLIYGSLPTQDQLSKFKKWISQHQMVNERMKRFFEGFAPNAHPMPVLISATSALQTFYQEWDDPRDMDQRELNIIRLLAKVPTLIAYSYKTKIGQPIVYPDDSLSYSGNFLRMMFALPTRKYVPDEDIADIFDKLLILHADHEQNCSTSSVRIVGSGLANLHLTVAAGMSALSGALHGGANEKVIGMLNNIVADGGNVQKYMDMAKDKSSGFRLFGFGHRVYKNYDPRALILKQSCHSLLNKIPIDNPLFEVALKLEEIALKDDYFVSRKLYPNVDFYSGLIYRALGIPVEHFTVMFALGRLPGWIAQWYEMIVDENVRISRPRQIYTGPDSRDYIPIEDRS
jgi:citrate synthase